MNKRFLITLATTMMTLSLVSCANNGSEEGRKKALNAAADAGIATAAGADLFNDELGSVNELSYGNALSLLTQYTYFNRAENFTYVVKIDWSYDKATYGEIGAKKFSEGYVKNWEPSKTTEYALWVRLNFDQEDHPFSFKGTLSIGDQTKEVNYNCNLEGRVFTYTEMTHEQFYETGSFTADEVTHYYYKNWQYGDDNADPCKTKDYYYDCGNLVTVYGKVTYRSSDGNFAFLENGDKIIYLWHMENDSYTPDYDMFQVGKYVKTSGYIASYHGFPQISNLQGTDYLTDEEKAAHVTEPTSQVLTPTGKNLAGTLAEGRYNQFGTYHNQQVTIRAHLKKAFTSGSAKGRFTVAFVAEDGTEFDVAYNYHISADKEGNIVNSIGDNMISFLKARSTTDMITIKGRLNYADPNDDAPASFYPGNKDKASWNVVPLSEDAFTLAA